MFTQRKLQFSIRIEVLLLLSAMFAALIGAALFTGEVNAQGASKCTLKTIKGTYVFEAQGVINDGQKVVPWAEAGTWTLDGAGNAQGIFSASMDGVTIATQKPLTATYELKPGCAYKAVDSEGLVFDLYPNDQANTMTYFMAGVSGTMFRR